MALDQILGNQDARGTKSTIAAFRDAPAAINLVALITRRIEAGSTVDRCRGCVVLDRPRFAR